MTVVSTTGDGDPPETVRRGWRRLRGKSLSSDHLKQLQFALLGKLSVYICLQCEPVFFLTAGLGDTNYDNFCNMGKVLDQRFRDLGATAFYPSGFADDAVG